jgi:hypothetical protein
MNLGQLLDQLQSTVQQAQQHQDVPMLLIQSTENRSTPLRDLHGAADKRSYSVATATCELLSDPNIPLPSEISIRRMPLPLRRIQQGMPLRFRCIETNNSLHIVLLYRVDRFHRDDMNKQLIALHNILTNIIRGIDKQVASLATHLQVSTG